MAESLSKTKIEAKGLSKYYGPFVAIRDISFAIPEGQIVAFLGPNGAGKSTTMKILAGYLAQSEGTAEIAGFGPVYGSKDIRSRDRLNSHQQERPVVCGDAARTWVKPRDPSAPTFPDDGSFDPFDQRHPGRRTAKTRDRGSQKRAAFHGLLVHLARRPEERFL